MLTELDPSYCRFPLWLELSGLPAKLHTISKGGYAWGVMKKLIELDLAKTPSRPALVEISPLELAERTGLDEKRITASVKAMRKLGILRAFLPDNEEEVALFQFLTPIPTPKSADQIRALYPDLFLDTEWPPRYAVEVSEQVEQDPETQAGKVKEVIDLYLNIFSMKLNSLILDQLQLMCDRYDQALIKKVFERARKKDATSLGWVMTEIRREMKVLAKAKELKDSD
jgi:DNA-binding Lrp family transcriptional regulator